MILGFKKQKDWDRLEKEIQEASQKFTSLEIRHIESLNDADFETQVMLNDSLSQNQLKLLANLLFEKMDYYLAQDDFDKFLNAKARCYALYKHLESSFTNNEFDLDVHYKLELIRKM